LLAWYMFGVVEIMGISYSRVTRKCSTRVILALTN